MAINGFPLFLSPDDGSGATPVLEFGEPKLEVDNPSACGEGPLWNEDERAVYWVDIPNGQLFRYDPAAGQNSLVYQHDGQIGGFTFQEDGSILLFCTAGKVVKWAAGETETILESVPGEEDGRFNDVVAAPDGSVFCGTMPTASHQAALYRLAPDGTITRLYDDIGLSNGFGFSPDNRTFYHTDSNKHLIYAIDLDPETGTLSNRRVIVRAPEDETVPDGMTVDAEGFIWSARWDGHALYKYSPEGEELGKVVFPVRKVSSIAFGGKLLDTAWVTTAGGDKRGDVEGPLAGSLFSIDLKVHGRAPFRSRVGI
jgi:sugar lactone lactonase YvrE